MTRGLKLLDVYCKLVNRSVFICLILLMLAGVRSLNAQSIAAQVSGKRVTVGEPFEFAVVISGQSSNYNQPNFRDFDVVSGPNQSSSMQIVNGVVSQQMVFSYALVARREGKFMIPSANAIINGQRMETQPIAIEAVRNAAATAQQGDDRRQGAEIFIKTTVSKSKCYVGEPITIIQKVYSRNQIVGYQKSVQPSYDGFYSQQQESPTKGQLIPENYEGVNYFTHEAMRTLATPNKPGKISLTPFEADIVVRRQSNSRPRNIFEQFFGAPGYEDAVVHASSRPVVIEVLPLPEQGKPENFDGAVGSFTQRVEISRSELKANEALNLKITIAGKGNLRLVNPPKLDLPEGFETYEPKVQEGVTSKTFDYLVIPRQEGEYELKNLDFSYFDLDTKKYVTLPSPPLKVKVLPGVAGEGAQVFTPHSQVKETENDIRYIKKGDFVLDKSEAEFFNSGLHFGLILAPLLGLAIALVLRYNHQKNNSDAVLVRERKAAGMARKRLVNAEKMKNAGNKDAFYTEILIAMNSYLSDRLNIPVADLNKDKIQSVMQARQVETEVVNKLMSTLNDSEYAKYAPGAVSGDLSAVYQDTVGLITAIEKQLSKKTA